MQIGFIATETYYIDHLVSIWLALPSRVRGPFFCDNKIIEYAVKWGIKRKHIIAISGTRRQKAYTLKNSFSGPVISASFSNWRVVNTAGLPAPHLPHGQGGEGPGSELWLQNASKVDFMLVPAHYGTIGMDPLNCIIIDGQPKLDRWYGHKPNNSKPVLAMSFRWRDIHSAADHYKPFLKEVKQKADKAGIQLLGHGHPLKFNSSFRYMWEEAGIPHDGSFENVLKTADVYAADCSSSSFEFVGLDRPVIFLDCPKYENLTRAPRFTLDRAGIINRDPSLLVEDALRALEDHPEVAARRREVAQLLHGGFEGKASQNAARAIMEFYGD